MIPYRPVDTCTDLNISVQSGRREEKRWQWRGLDGEREMRYSMRLRGGGGCTWTTFRFAQLAVIVERGYLEEIFNLLVALYLSPNYAGHPRILYKTF